MKKLFHRLVDPESVAARRLFVARRVRAEFLNVHFPEHAADLAAHGGEAVPAFWDGERLHTGLAAIEAALASPSA